MHWAKQLERSGVHVVYGMVGLKTHSKVVLVVRDDGDQLRRYVHVGTGNYNAKTARIYEDIGVLTCSPDIGDDAAQLFNHLTGYSRSDDYRNLLVRAARPAPPARRPDRTRGVVRARRSHHAEVQLDRRRRDDRSALRGERRGHADRHRRARDLLPARRGSRAVGDDPRPQHPRPLPRTQPDLPVRPRQRRARRTTARSDVRRGVPDRFGRPDAAQPQPTRRSDGADRACPSHGGARPGARRSPSPTTSWRGSSRPTTRGCASGRPTRSSRIRRSGCTAGWSSNSSPDAA